MADQPTVIVTGLVRDCQRSLPRLLKSIVRLGRRMPAWRYLFIENDSVDRSRLLLTRFHGKYPNGTVLKLDGMEKTYPKRTHRLAAMRNMTIDHVFDQPVEADSAYLLILDMDGANSWVDTHRLARLMKSDDGSWSGLFANQSKNYYDLWALRHAEFGPTDVWKEVRERPAGMSEEQAIQTFVNSRRFSLPADAGRIEVESAFGGMGLYRLSDIRDCRYLGLDDQGEEICEHVAFHQDMRSRGKALFIDTGLINGSGVQPHDYEPTLYNRAKHAVRQRLARMKENDRGTVAIR